MKTLDFYFDYGSPAAYLAWTQLPALCAQAGATLVNQPFLLGGAFQATGNRPPISVPAKGMYLFKDLTRYAKRYGVVFNMNPNFPINTLTFMRAAVGLQMREPTRLEAFSAAVFKGIWVDGLNLNDPQIVGSMLAGAGFDPAAMMTMASDAAVKDELKARTEAAVARGIFGAPTFFVGDEMFWGQDRLDFVREALA